MIDTFGRDVARRLMLRFGYADGYHDAVNMRERAKWPDPVEGLRQGAVLHTLEGSARVEIVSLERDETGRFEMEIVWHDSYTAQQYLHHYGTSEEPVCWSLVGYATGYARIGRPFGCKTR